MGILPDLLAQEWHFNREKRASITEPSKHTWSLGRRILILYVPGEMLYVMTSKRRLLDIKYRTKFDTAQTGRPWNV